MKFKKQISLLLCAAVIFSSATLPSYASDGTKTGTPEIINTAEEIAGIVINYFAKLINNIKGTDETAIPSATVNPHSWVEYNGEPIENPEQVLNAETWIANEIAFESEKSYTNPFNDVDVELMRVGIVVNAQVLVRTRRQHNNHHKAQYLNNPFHRLPPFALL